MSGKLGYALVESVGVPPWCEAKLCHCSLNFHIPRGLWWVARLLKTRQPLCVQQWWSCGHFLGDIWCSGHDNRMTPPWGHYLFWFFFAAQTSTHVSVNIRNSVLFLTTSKGLPIKAVSLFWLQFEASSILYWDSDGFFMGWRWCDCGPCWMHWGFYFALGVMHKALWVLFIVV